MKAVTKRWLAEPKPRRGKGWPPSRRRAQAENIRRTRPWLRSTGPRTASGKARARMNGLKHGLRSTAMRRLQCLMRRQRLFLRLLDILPAHKALVAVSTLTPVIARSVSDKAIQKAAGKNWIASLPTVARNDGKIPILLRHSASPRKNLPLCFRAATRVL